MKEILIPVTDFRELKEGDIVRCVARNELHGHWKFQLGKDYQVKRHQHMYSGEYVFAPVDADGDGIGSEDFGHQFARVVTSGEVAEKVVHVQQVKEKRGKLVYGIHNRHGDLVHAFTDRNDAREFKAYWGGKASGVSIIAYAPIKEIR